MRRSPVVRALGACFALWFGLATGEYGLANACWAASPDAEQAAAPQHHDHGAPSQSSETPDHHRAADHANCLTHCAGVVGTTPAFAAVPTFHLPHVFAPPARPVSNTLPGVPAGDHPFANGPPLVLA